MGSQGGRSLVKYAGPMTQSTGVQIELDDATKAYGTHVVLQRIGLSVPQGQFLAVMGRSGSGKSTLLKLIGGLDTPDSGAVMHGGHSLNSMTERERARFRRRSLGFVFQFFNLIPTLTVNENVQLPLELNGIKGIEAADRTAKLLEELDLTDCAERFPEELSGGEQQRVAIARALVHEPELVIADEPTGNLDLDTANRVLELLDASCRQRHTTLIIATHSREVANLADRVLSIRNARLQAAEA